MTAALTASELRLATRPAPFPSLSAPIAPNPPATPLPRRSALRRSRETGRALPASGLPIQYSVGLTAEAREVARVFAWLAREILRAAGKDMATLCALGLFVPGFVGGIAALAPLVLR